MMSKKLKPFQRFEYLVYGYTRITEKECDLYMNIETGIPAIIYAFYPKLLRFDLYDKNRFDVSDDGLSIKGKRLGCDGYVSYIESPEGKGFNAGVHYLSVKNVRDEHVHCFKNVGVMAKRDRSITNEAKGWGNWTQTAALTDKTLSFYGTFSHYGGKSRWKYGDIVTVKLDCDEWKVTYYHDHKRVQMDQIKPNKSYHFVINCCENPRYSHFEIVEFVPNEL